MARRKAGNELTVFRLGVVAGVVLATASVAAEAASSDRAFREVRVQGKIVAELRYVRRSDFLYSYYGQTLRVTRAGRVSLEKRLTPERYRWPYPAGRALTLLDLDGAGEPEVVV